jgi:hypothetical protein
MPLSVSVAQAKVFPVMMTEPSHGLRKLGKSKLSLFLAVVQESVIFG